MKKRIFSILFIACTISSSAYAQQNKNLKRIPITDIGKMRTDTNYYIYDNNFNKFVGTWIGKEGERTVKITFFKKYFRLTSDPANQSEIEYITGTFQYFNNNNLIKSYTNDEISASSHSNDSLDVFIDVKARKTQAALLVSFLQNGTIKLEAQKNIFESKNDKDFEFQGSMTLTKQN